MMKWADEMAFNAATLHCPQAAFVTKLFGQFDFTTPVQQGQIIKIFSQVASRSTTSCKVNVWATNCTTGAAVFSTFAVMVNVRNNQKEPL